MCYCISLSEINVKMFLASNLLEIRRVSYTAAFISFDIDHGYFRLGMLRNTLFSSKAWTFYVNEMLMKSQVQAAASPIIFAIVLENVLVGFTVSSSIDLVF